MFPRDPNAPEPPAEIQRVKRDLYDWLMFAIGFAGVVGVLATIVVTLINNASNSADTAKAIDRMSLIANSMAAERPAIESQAVSAADSAKAARDSAEAAKGQTSAISKQAAALIKSAESTIVGASAQLAAAQANTKTAEAGAKAAELQQQSATLYAATRVPLARLKFVDVSGWDDAVKDGKVALKFTPHIENVGGGVLLPSVTSFNVVAATELPANPPISQQSIFGGNDQPIAAGADLIPIVPIEHGFTKSEIDSIKNGKLPLVVWGRVEFSDVSGKSHHKCYLSRVIPPTKDRAGGQVVAINFPLYQCDD